MALLKWASGKSGWLHEHVLQRNAPAASSMRPRVTQHVGFNEQRPSTDSGSSSIALSVTGNRVVECVPGPWRQLPRFTYAGTSWAESAEPRAAAQWPRPVDAGRRRDRLPSTICKTTARFDSASTLRGLSRSDSRKLRRGEVRRSRPSSCRRSRPIRPGLRRERLQSAALLAANSRLVRIVAAGGARCPC